MKLEWSEIEFFHTLIFQISDICVFKYCNFSSWKLKKKKKRSNVYMLMKKEF